MFLGVYYRDNLIQLIGIALKFNLNIKDAYFD